MKTSDLLNRQVDYSNGLLNTARLILINDFILEMCLEDQYLHHLSSLSQQEEWKEFYPVINETIREYSISSFEIEQAISDLIQVPEFCF